MRPATLERSLISYAVGALLGCCAILAEGLLSTTLLTWGALAVYSLAGGAVATASRSLLARVVSAPAARAGALGAVAAFGSLHLLYFANVKLLPGDHYLSWLSLAMDLAIVSFLLAGSVLLARARWAQRIRLRWGSAGAALGAALLATGVAVLMAVWPRGTPEPERHGEGPNLVLIVMDSVRRDRLPASGEADPAMPSLHQVARRGRTFAAAWAASSWTVPSVASMLGAGFGPGGQRPSLAERLASHGYRTLCFTDNPHLWSGSPLMRGFDRVERSVGAWRRILRSTALGEILERLDPGSDRRLVDEALRWADGQPGPFLLYLHLMDAHTPYRFSSIDGRRGRGRRIEFPFTGMRMTAEERRDITARYDGGVRSVDAQVGRLLAAVPRWGRTFVAVVTADHGESLGESGRWFHGQSLAPELLAVPLVVVGEGVTPGRVDAPVGHAAIMPTLLTAAGIGCPDCSGPDLRTQAGTGVVEGGLPPRFAYRIAGRHKVVLDLESGRRHLFDLRADPDERRDLAGEKAATAAALSAGLVGTVPLPPPTPDGVERLRSLGYAGS